MATLDEGDERKEITLEPENEIVIEIVCTKTGEVVRTIDITHESKKNAEKIEAGIQRNLNHDEYHTRTAARRKRAKGPR